MNIQRYTPSKKNEWDSFVKESRNGTFLFLRDYMDYHGYDAELNPNGRFHDHSLLYYNVKGMLIAIMPANEDGNELWSHQGLTYGGLVLSDLTRVEDVCDAFDATIAYLRSLGFTAWYYKQIPTIYQKSPSQEDEYALWLHNAQLVKCGVSSTITGCMPMSHDKKRAFRDVDKYFFNYFKGRYNFSVSDEFDVFWPILEENLMSTYGARPVHTLDEIKLLQKRFPNNIGCYVAYNIDTQEPDAGAVVYKSTEWVHTQYLSSTPQGKKNHAMDYMIAYLMNECLDRLGYEFLDLGTSTDRDGRSLQPGLISYKQSFGGRATAYKIYKIDIPQLLTPHS